MKKPDETRRRLIKTLSALPLGLMLGGCYSKTTDGREVSVDSLAEAFHILVARLGPFPVTDSDAVDRFAVRFIESPAGAQIVTEGGVTLITGIARRLPSADGPLVRLDFSKFSETERRWILLFVGQLYSFLEIRNRVAGEPIFGECQGDNLYYTHPI